MNTKIILSEKNRTANSRFKKWRKMCKIHIFLSQEFLSLTENMPLRSSPLHEAAERQDVKKPPFFL
jgi:hypothetical protein